eukprot:m.442694 g.442694  ORF g.442694 m.442694 type:complete len:487 (+) comp18840_c0_seq1:1984-3444(+)
MKHVISKPSSSNLFTANVLLQKTMSISFILVVTALLFITGVGSSEQGHIRDMDISTTLNYGKDDGTRPFFYGKHRSDAEKAADAKLRGQMHQGMFGGGGNSVKVSISDARGKKLTLDEVGFELVDQRTDMSTEDFYNKPDKITDVYYKEIAAAIVEATGAAHCKIIHHQVRNASKAGQDIQNVGAQVQGYAAGIHTDSHPKAADDLFKHTVEKLVADGADPNIDWTKGRFLYVNAWRNISNEPVQRDPLAVCDARSVVAPDDFIASDIFLDNYDSMQFRLDSRNAKSHRWHYFSRMKKEEVLLFKQWDSDPTRPRACFHTAFNDPGSPDSAPVRESIEVRAVAFFPHHTPNTCPEVLVTDEADRERIDPVAVAEGVSKITGAVKFLPLWPAIAQEWAMGHINRGDKGIETLATELCKDARGNLGLKDVPPITRAQIVSELTAKDSSFRRTVRSSVLMVQITLAVKKWGPPVAIGFALGTAWHRLRS